MKFALDYVGRNVYNYNSFYVSLNRYGGGNA